MTSAALVVLCLAYVLGLLSTAFSWGGYAILGLGVVIAVTLLLPLPGRIRVLKAGLKPTVWLIAGVIGFLATLYFQFRMPQPAANDISSFVAPSEGTHQQQVVTVLGKVTSTPRVTRTQKAQFWLNASQLTEIVGVTDNIQTDTAKTKPVSGKLYVTVPLLQATGVSPGQRVSVTGKLYEPKPPANPGAFNFQAYLAREGSFAGLTGRQVSFPSGNPIEHWGLWQVRRQIIRAHALWLGVPKGPLVSSLVLGRRAVDLPYEIQDRFIEVGLAHALAASGFHVAVILGLVLVVTRRFSERVQFGVGMGVLLIYVALTGGGPSVLRAAVMGFAGLVAPVLDRKVNPVGSLLVAAILLLLINPLWIRDLGFQLSFLATLGLVVSVPAFMKRLEWLPPTIASLVAVPIAASMWTLPLVLYVFYRLSVYSIFVNILTSWLLSIITIGGFVSAIAGVIWPLAGSALAWLLYYPVNLLIVIVEFFSELPGNSVATGTLSVLQLLVLYSLIGMVWLIPWLHQQRRWLFAFLFAVGLVVVPALHTRATVFQVTVLATGEEPVLVIQDRGQVTLVNSGDDKTARYTVLPFLQQQAVNKIDWAIATSSLGSKSGWHQILDELSVGTFSSVFVSGNNPSALNLLDRLKDRQGIYQPLSVGQKVAFSSNQVKFLSLEPQVVQFQIRDQIWLWLDDLNPSEQNQLVTGGQLSQAIPNSPLDVLWWSGAQLTPYLIEALQPKVAIATSDSIDSETLALLAKSNVNIYSLGREGGLQWTPDNGFATTLNFTENHTPLL